MLQNHKSIWNHGKSALAFSCLILIILCVLLVTKIAPYENRDPLTLERLDFVGTYQFTEQDVPKSYTNNTKVDASKQDTLILKGYFNRPVSGDVQVLFLIRFLEVHIFSGETEVYSFGEEGSYSPLMQSKGSTWGHFIMPFNASADKEWTIVLKSKYTSNYSAAYQNFMNSLFTGDQVDLLHRIFERNLFYVIPGVLFWVFGVAVLLVSAALYRGRVHVNSSVPISAGLMVAMSLTILLNPVLATLILDSPVLILFFETVTLLVSASLLLLYIRCFCSPSAKKAVGVGFLLTLASAFWYFAAQLLGYVDAFSCREYLVPFYFFLLVCILLLSVIEIFKLNAGESRFVFLSLMILVVFYILEAANYEWELMPRNFFMTIGFWIFVITQAYLAVKNIARAMLAAKQVAEMEKEMAENQMAIMLSQIQPHFLYNALNTIRYLCLTQPKLAGQTVEQFAKYLRANMDSLKQKEPIPFEQELNHLKNYLAIEQLRFDDVKIEYDLEVMDFKLPALTIQPVVENAIKHGVTQREEGGTVTIKTWEDKENTYIRITDDGVGFDMSQKKKPDGRSHIGVENTRERVAAMCGGRMEMKSHPGEGTVVTITLPRKS